MIASKKQHRKNKEENVSSLSISIKYNRCDNLQIQKKKARVNDKWFLLPATQIYGKMHHFKALYKSVYFPQNCDIFIYLFVF